MESQTLEKVTKFLAYLEALGKSQNTLRQYKGYLRRFADEVPELPLDTPTLEQYLKRRKETPAHRGQHFKVIQALYSYLQDHEGIKSPVPPKGQRGRPVRTWGPITGARAGAPQGPPAQAVAQVIPGTPQVEYPPVDTMSAIERYMKFKVAEGASGRTQEQYRCRLFPFAKSYQVVPTDPDEVARFLAALDVSPETRWDYRKHVIAFYHFLERRHEIPELTKLFPRVKVPRKVRRVLSPEELGRLFANCQNYQEKAALTLLLDSKIRASELCTLTRENTFEDHIIVTGKTGQRSVPISQDTYKMIVKLADKGYLFTVRGQVMKREYLRIMFRDLMVRSGLSGKKLGPHIIRHSASVQHIMFGGDLLSLQKELGHTTTKMTEKYAELAEADVSQIHGRVDVLGRITGNGKPKRAICFGCHTEISVNLEDVKKTKCPGCDQVGKWYLPEVRPEELARVA